MDKKILVADIGGTSSRFASYALSASGELTHIASNWLKTAEAKSFGNLLDQLRATPLELKPEAADVCVFAIAGPVERGVFCNPPLIPWEVDLRNSERDFGIRYFGLINDFLAQAYACRSPIGRKSKEILPGTADETAAVGVIGAGTGLGKAILLPDGDGGYVGGPSEGGHTNFPAETPREFELNEFLAKRCGGHYATWNDIVSGRGLSFLHEFLTGEKLEPAKVAAHFVEGSETFKWATTMYGRVCRNFALETLCFGGLFIAGGVAAKNPLLVTSSAFQKAFYDNHVHRKVLEKIPVYLNDNEESGLWGAAFYGVQALRRRRNA